MTMDAQLIKEFDKFEEEDAYERDKLNEIIYKFLPLQEYVYEQLKDKKNQIFQDKLIEIHHALYKVFSIINNFEKNKDYSIRNRYRVIYHEGVSYSSDIEVDYEELKSIMRRHSKVGSLIKSIERIKDREYPYKC